jgi:phospholipid N-methyltransferase
MKSFFQEAIRTLKTSGTIRPSSKYLIKKSLKSINFDKARVILEFGSGDGCFTDALAEKMHPDAVLFSFEVNPSFFRHCANRFAGRSNLRMLNHSAVDFDEILQAEGIPRVDYVVSSLPLSLLKEEMVREMLEKVTRYLHPDGKYIQYQYSPEKYLLLKKYFDKVEVKVSLRNLPPALIYTCSNSGRTGQ